MKLIKSFVPHSRCFGSYFDVIFLMYLVSSGFSFKPTSSCSSSSSSTQFSQEWARSKVVVKHSIKSNIGKIVKIVEMINKLPKCPKNVTNIAYAFYGPCNIAVSAAFGNNMYIWLIYQRGGGRRSPAVACWAPDHWVAGSNPLRGMFRH